MIVCLDTCSVQILFEKFAVVIGCDFTGIKGFRSKVTCCNNRIAGTASTRAFARDKVFTQMVEKLMLARLVNKRH